MKVIKTDDKLGDNTVITLYGKKKVSRIIVEIIL